jgi:hypothetical protein
LKRKKEKGDLKRDWNVQNKGKRKLEAVIAWLLALNAEKTLSNQTKS